MDTPVSSPPALPVPHPGQEGIVAYRLHRLVPRPLRPDSHRYAQSARHALQPWVESRRCALGCRCLSSLKAAAPQTASCKLSFWRSLPRHSRPGSAGAHRAERRVRPAAHPHTPSFPGPLTLRAGEPIDTTGMTVRQTDELTERLRAAIEEMTEARQRSRRLDEFQCCISLITEERNPLSQRRGSLHWCIHELSTSPSPSQPAATQSTTSGRCRPTLPPSIPPA
jgi:hypothetical protein